MNMEAKQLYTEQHHHLDEALGALASVNSHVLRAFDIEGRRPDGDTWELSRLLDRIQAVHASIADQMVAILPMTR